MILDYHVDDPLDELNSFEIIDLSTNMPLSMDPPYCDVIYADDEAGVLRILMRDESGQVQLAWDTDPHTPINADLEYQQYAMVDRKIVKVGPECIAAWREEKRAIKIVKKSELV